jgi:hypothetical protein
MASYRESGDVSNDGRWSGIVVGPHRVAEQEPIEQEKMGLELGAQYQVIDKGKSKEMGR